MYRLIDLLPGGVDCIDDNGLSLCFSEMREPVAEAGLWLIGVQGQ